MSEAAKKRVRKPDTRVRGKADLPERTRQAGAAHLKPAFLAAFRIKPVIATAAKTVGVHKSTVYRDWLGNDPEFKEAFLQAEAEAIDELVIEARRRALEGVFDYVVSMGKLVMDPDDPTKPLTKRVYSDKLMELLLRSHRPELYGNRTAIEHSGSVRTIQELLIGIPAGQEDDSVPLLGEGSVDVLTDGSS